MKKFTHPALDNEETGEAQFFNVRSHKIVCPACNGEGTHTRRDLEESRLVEAMQEDGDEDGLTDYYSGAFDEFCGECKGLRVVEEIDFEAFEREHPKEAKKISDWHDEERQSRAYADQERRAGA